MIANAVNLPPDLPPYHPDVKAVSRIPAHDLLPESDLGCRPVTRQVGALSAASINYALNAGEAETRAIMAIKPIAGALIRVKDHIRVVGLDQNLDQSLSQRTRQKEMIP